MGYWSLVHLYIFLVEPSWILIPLLKWNYKRWCLANIYVPFTSSSVVLRLQLLRQQSEWRPHAFSGCNELYCIIYFDCLFGSFPFADLHINGALTLLFAFPLTCSFLCFPMHLPSSPNTFHHLLLLLSILLILTYIIISL